MSLFSPLLKKNKHTLVRREFYASWTLEAKKAICYTILSLNFILSKNSSTFLRVTQGFSLYIWVYKKKKAMPRFHLWKERYTSILMLLQVTQEQRLYRTQIIWVCSDIWVFSVLDNRHLSDIWVICQKK